MIDSTPPTVVCFTAGQLTPDDVLAIAPAGEKWQVADVLRATSTSGAYVVWFRVTDPTAEGGVRYASKFYEADAPVEVL